MRLLVTAVGIVSIFNVCVQAIAVEPTAPTPILASSGSWWPKPGQTRCFEQADEVDPTSNKPQQPLSVLSFRLTADATQPEKFSFVVDVKGFSPGTTSQTGNCIVDDDHLACTGALFDDRVAVQSGSEGPTIVTTAAAWWWSQVQQQMNDFIDPGTQPKKTYLLRVVEQSLCDGITRAIDVHAFDESVCNAMHANACFFDRLLAFLAENPGRDGN